MSRLPGQARKDKDSPGGAIAVAAPETVEPAASSVTAKEYRELIVRYRKEQLSLNREGVRRLREVYDDAVKRIVSLVEALPDTAGPERSLYYANMLHSIDREVRNLKADFGDLLDIGMTESAQVAADREAATAKLVGAAEDARLTATQTHTFTTTTGVALDVQFGDLAVDAVRGVAARVYRDGLKLSQRLYRLDQQVRTVVDKTVVGGVAEQISARDLGRRLETHLMNGMAVPETATETERVMNVRYNAMRIARTEIGNAHREAHIRSVTDPETRGLKDYVEGVRWNLSYNHPRPDVCDAWAASGSDGLDDGVYLPSDVPVDHPHGLCYTTTELAALPGIGGAGKRPDLAAVPEGQLRYYAEEIEDPAVLRLLARKAA